MTQRFLPIIIFILQFQVLSGQHTKVIPYQHGTATGQNDGIKSDVIITPLTREILPSSSTTIKWAVSVRPTFSRSHGNETLRQLKAEKLEEKLNSYFPAEETSENTRAVHPEIGVNFEANWTLKGTPPDNSLAISNGGFIVTANNDGIEYYNASGSFLYFDFWSDFFDDNTLIATLFDPKVIYDSGADRFVLVVLHGSNAANSKVMIAFSKTNNPQNGWWIYTLTGNPLNNNCWFDYPALGVSNNEVYITGNLFSGNSFQQAVLYQIPKAAGYAGQSLSWQYWSGLSSSPYKAFTLVPASYGHQGNYGPGIYLVSNESVGDYRIRLWDLTDDMSGNPEMFSYTITTSDYSPAGDAFQQGTQDRLDNGDCRIQNAFYLNGILHFVFHSDIGQGWNGINYNRLDVGSTTITSARFGLQGSYDYSYPAVVPFSTTQEDLSVMIAFLRSSEDSYPSLRVVHCDHALEWSPSKLVRAGETFVDFLNGDERWGDYTGIARQHNSASGRIWMAGCYGAHINSHNKFNTYKTWVAEIYGGAVVSVSDPSPVTKVSVFPNPTYDLIYLTFSVEQLEEITIELWDMAGRPVRSLYRDMPKPGEHALSFNKNALPAGSYLITIKNKTKILKNEIIVVMD